MYVWQTHLNVQYSPEDQVRYNDCPRSNLVDTFSSARKFVLEIGCSSGATGLYCKQKSPSTIYWGIEPNPNAAKTASERLDRVLIGLSEDFVLSEHGVQFGQIDGVIMADVIEHMYNPWKALTDLKPYLSPDAEIVTSIPNIRNLELLNDIATGRFTYQEAGLLDITHIRFFTWLEIVDMMKQCGYEINHVVYGIDDRLWGVYHQYKAQLPSTVDFKSLSIKNVNEKDLAELCSVQFYSRAVQMT